jgi:hypothetical protein
MRRDARLDLVGRAIRLRLPPFDEPEAAGSVSLFCPSFAPVRTPHTQPHSVAIQRRAWGARMNNKTIWILLVAALIAALVTAAFWHHDRQAQSQLRAQVIAGELQPIAELLKENQALLKDLQTEPFTEKDSGILESYLAKIRRDGVAKNAQMKQRLDQLAENNTAIVALIKAYASHAKTPVFVAEADKFRNYASAWRDRWNSVMELFMAGGNYPVSGVPFPTAFTAAVGAEILAVK